MDRLNNLAFNRERRKRLRNSPTFNEVILWNLLKGSGIGFKFRRQAGIGPYIADFYCPSKKLVVELDGPSHLLPESKAYDAERDDYMKALGIRVLRFTNEECDVHFARVIFAIKAELKVR